MEFETSTKSKTEAFELVHLEEGIYEATLKEVKDISDGQYGQRVAFIYTIEGKDLALVCYKTKATLDNKIGQTLIAHGVKIDDSKVDTDNLPKKVVRAWVDDYSPKDEKGQPKKDDNGKVIVSSTISKVKSLIETPKE